MKQEYRMVDGIPVLRIRAKTNTAVEVLPSGHKDVKAGDELDVPAWAANALINQGKAESAEAEVRGQRSEVGAEEDASKMPAPNAHGGA